jgi:stage V sporulation protein B
VLLSKVLGYVYRIIIARYFGPEIYGLFTLAITILSLFVFFFALGLGDGISRYIPLYRGKKEVAKIQHVVRITAWISLFSGIIAALALFFLSNFIAVNLFHNQGLVIYLQIFSFLIPIMIFAQFFLNILRAYEHIKWFSFIFNILQNLVKVVFIILLILMGVGSNSVVFSHFLGISSMLIVGYLICRYKVPQVFEKSMLSSGKKKSITKEIIHYSLPFMPFSIMSILLYWIDSFSIGFFKDAAAVGLYNAAVPIAMLLSFVPELFTQLFFPLINKEFSRKNFRLIGELSRQVGKWILLLNLPIFILMIIFPGTLINVLFGQEYLVAIDALRLLAIGAFISSIFVVSNNLVSMAGKSKLFFANIVAASILNIVLNYFLVPIYGITGAAFATMIASILLSLLFFIEAKYYTAIVPFRGSMLKILAVSLIPTILVIFLRKLIPINLLTLILMGIFFVVVYLGLIILTRCFDANDMMIWAAIKRKIFPFLSPSLNNV